MLSATAKLVQDLPPFFIADGTPAVVRAYNKVGLERHGFDASSVKAIKEAYRLIYRSDLNLQQAIEQIRQDLPDSVEVGQLLAFVSHSPRGIIK